MAAGLVLPSQMPLRWKSAVVSCQRVLPHCGVSRPASEPPLELNFQQLHTAFMQDSVQDKIQAFKDHVIHISSDTAFLHHKWFVKWHLNIVEDMALELADLYPKADRDLVQVMAWLHDYGKIL